MAAVLRHAVNTRISLRYQVGVKIQRMCLFSVVTKILKSGATSPQQLVEKEEKKIHIISLDIWKEGKKNCKCKLAAQKNLFKKK